MTISQYQLDTMLARMARNKARANGEAEAEALPAERERGLHTAITIECNRRGWLPFHGSMAHPTYRTVGEPDFTILLPHGRVWLVEAKSKTGKLRLEQQAVKMLAERLGHTYLVVRSIAEFRKLADDYESQHPIRPPGVDHFTRGV